MGWSMDRQGIRTSFDRESRRLKQVELSGLRRERVSLATYPDDLSARERALAIARGDAARLYLFYHRQQIGRKASAFALLEAMPALRLVEPRPTELHANPSRRSRTRATS
jgi:hypothetical protein